MGDGQNQTYLAAAGSDGYAWEFVRRSPEYRAAWADWKKSGGGPSASILLEWCAIDPSLRVDEFWAVEIQIRNAPPQVLRIFAAANGDRNDLTVRQRCRLNQMLRVIDARLSGRTYKEIAEAEFGLYTDETKSRVCRLWIRGQKFIHGGWREILIKRGKLRV